MVEDFEIIEPLYNYELSSLLSNVIAISFVTITSMFLLGFLISRFIRLMLGKV